MQVPGLIAHVSFINNELYRTVGLHIAMILNYIQKLTNYLLGPIVNKVVCNY